MPGDSPTAKLPVVFIPGLLCTGRIYQHQALALGKDRPVLFADHASHDTFANMALAILAVAPEKFALIGTSMGGYAALEIMRKAPDRVGALALLSTSAKPDAPEKSKARRDQVKTAREKGVREVSDALYPKLVHPARAEDASLCAVFDAMAKQTGADGFANQIEAIIGRADSRPHLAHIHVPTLVVAGADDELIPPDHSEEIADGIKAARLEKIPHCGHMGMIERPETYTQLLRDFLG